MNYANTMQVSPSVVGWLGANVPAFDFFKPQGKGSKQEYVRTEFGTLQSHDIELFAQAKGAMAPTKEFSAQTPSVHGTDLVSKEKVTSRPSEHGQFVNPEIETIAKQRIQLMAAKYAAGKESTEIVARLEILNRRLLEKAPRVTTAQVQALENAESLLARSRAAREERSKRLGLRTAA